MHAFGRIWFLCHKHGNILHYRLTIFTLSLEPNQVTKLWSSTSNANCTCYLFSSYLIVVAALDCRRDDYRSTDRKPSPWNSRSWLSPRWSNMVGINLLSFVLMSNFVVRQYLWIWMIEFSTFIFCFGFISLSFSCFVGHLLWLRLLCVTFYFTPLMKIGRLVYLISRVFVPFLIWSK